MQLKQLGYANDGVLKELKGRMSEMVRYVVVPSHCMRVLFNPLKTKLAGFRTAATSPSLGGGGSSCLA